MITNLYDLFYPDNLNLLWFDRLETFGSSGFSKWKQNADFCFGTSCFYLRFRSHSSYLIYIYLQFYYLIYALLRKRARQSQPNDFSLGWKNIFFVRMLCRRRAPVGGSFTWNQGGNVRPRHVFSLFDVILPTENEWQNVTDWLPPLPVHFLLASFVWSFFGLFVGNKCDLLSNGIGETARESRIFGKSRPRDEITDSHEVWIDSLPHWQCGCNMSIL